jgi:hypothetical protein
MSMQTTHWVINVEADAFILIFSCNILFQRHINIISAFVAIPHALIYLILYPIKKLFEIIRKKWFINLEKGIILIRFIFEVFDEIRGIWSFTSYILD